MNEASRNQGLEERVRELLAGGEARRPELNSLLRENDTARPIVARVLFEEAAMIAELRIENVKKWAGSLQPRTIEELAGPRVRSSRGRVAAFVLAAAACVAFATHFFFKAPGPPGPAAATQKRTETWIGVVSGLDGGDPSAAGRTLLKKGEFEIGARRARIDLDNGVVISVTGPARLTVGLEQCRLWQGQIGVDVPEDLDNYVVETESGRFVDLGTTFSVSVQPGKPTEMSVQKGLVRAERISYEGDVLSEQLVRRAEGVVMDASAPVIQTVKAGDLGHEAPIPLAGSLLVVPQAYRDAVAASTPLIAWDFEQQHADRTVSNRFGAAYSGKILGAVDFKESAAGNRHIVLGESEGGGWIEVPAPWIKDDAAPFTIELLARPERIQWGHLLNIRVDENLDPATGKTPMGPLSYFSLEMTRGHEFEMLPRDPSIRCTFRSPPTEHPVETTPGGVNAGLFSTERYFPGKWYHLAARVDQGDVTFFIDGIEVSRQVITRPSLGSFELGIRLGALIGGPTTFRQFVGGIDEVAIYERALSDAEVLEHFRLLHEANR